MRLLIFIQLIIIQPLFSQNSFYTIDGSDLFPDTVTLRKNNIIQIQRNFKSFVITKNDTSELKPFYHNDYYFNPLGLVDSLVTWSGDDSDSVLCIDRQYNITDTNYKWAEFHFYQYYNTFSQGRGGNHWSSGKNQWHYYRMLKNTAHKFPKRDSTLVSKIKTDTSKAWNFLEKYEFYENGAVKKDSLYRIDKSGIESKTVRYYFYNEQGCLSKVTKNNCTKPGVYSFVDETHYEYDKAKHLTKKILYSDKEKKGKLLRSLFYDEEGNLLREETAATKTGIKSRAYFYDSKKSLVKIKEKHAARYILVYTISYDVNGLLQKIISHDKSGKFVDMQTFTYLKK